MSDQKEFEKMVFAPNDVLFEERKEGDCAFLILKGKVELRAGTHTDVPRVLATVGTGDIIGEMALFDNQPRMATARAVMRTECIRISHEAFRRRLDQMDPVMRSIILMMSKRMRSLATELAEYRKYDWRSS